MIIQTLKLMEQTYSTEKLVSGTTIYFPPSILKQIETIWKLYFWIEL